LTHTIYCGDTDGMEMNGVGMGGMINSCLSVSHSSKIKQIHEADY